MKKILIDVPGYGQTKNGKELYPFSLKVNDYAYLYDTSGFDNTNTWRTIQITYIRGSVVFFVFTDNTSKEYYFDKKAVLVQCGNIKPIEFIVNTNEWPLAYYKFICDCPFTKITYEANIR